MKVLLPPGKEPLVVAVSGGVDSMSLLDYLIRCSERPLTVAHFDHRVRAGSSADAAFVAEWCSTRGVACVVKTADHSPGTQNLEAWGREQRYHFFETVRSEARAEWIVTAHTADDVAETFLMKLLSNKEATALMQRDHERFVWRPFFAVRKDELQEYAQLNHVPFHLDPTNLHLDRLRNRIRHQIMPLLPAVAGSSVLQSLLKSARGVSEDIHLLRSLAFELVPRNEAPGSRAWMQCLRASLTSAPDGLKWRAAEAALLPMIGYRVGRTHARLVAAFFLSNAPQLEIPKFLLRRKQGGLEVIARRNKS